MRAILVIRDSENLILYIDCHLWGQMTQNEASRGAPRQLPESMAASREAQAPGEASHTLVMDNETMIEVGKRI
jgi:hypothetical protein